jgi:hypothetical protein
MEMTDIAWVSVAVIAICITITVFLFYRRSDNFAEVPIPGCKRPLRLSSRDAAKIIALQNRETDLELIKVLAKYNRPGKKPDARELQQIPDKTLELFALKGYIEPPKPEIRDIREFVLGYIGHQFLEAEFDKIEEPITWHDEVLSAYPARGGWVRRPFRGGGRG